MKIRFKILILPGKLGAWSSVKLDEIKQLSHPEAFYDKNSEEDRGPEAVANMFRDYFIVVGQSTVYRNRFFFSQDA